MKFGKYSAEWQQLCNSNYFYRKKKKNSWQSSFSSKSEKQPSQTAYEQLIVNKIVLNKKAISTFVQIC